MASSAQTPINEHPSLFRGTSRVDAPDDGKLLGERLSDDAIKWIHNQKAADPDKPFFLYLAPGAGHAPAQAPASLIASFRGHFDEGWDKLRMDSIMRQKDASLIPRDTKATPRPESIPAWSTLPADQRRIAARFMEAYAAALAYEDQQIGRVVQELKRMGQLDNTLIIYLVGDNGADSQGGIRGLWNELAAYDPQLVDSDADRLAALDKIGSEDAYALHPVGWSWAMGAPFPYLKQIASHLGGSRNGLVISWPDRLGPGGGLRSQFAHVTDITLTIYDAAGITPPEIVNGAQQKPLAGTSLLYSFSDPTAPTRHRTQYFELLGNRAIYHDGWWANTMPQILPWTYDPGRTGYRPASAYQWELYNLTKDYAQNHDLAKVRLDKLREMQQLWAVEAAKNDVLPLDPRMGGERAAAVGSPTGMAPRTRYTFWGKGSQLAWDEAPMLGYLGFTLDAEVVIPPEGAEDVLAASGSHIGGWSFYLDKGRPVAVEAIGVARPRIFRIAGTDALTPGRHFIRYTFTRTERGGGTLAVEVDSKVVAHGPVGQVMFRGAGQGESFDVGFDSGGRVTDAYSGRGDFTGELLKLEVNITYPQRTP